MKNYKEYFNQLHQFWTSEQDLRFSSHLYKHNSTCFMTQIIRRYRVPWDSPYLQAMALKNSLRYFYGSLWWSRV